jgi:hypothetical protein
MGVKLGRLHFREQTRLKIFENRVLKRIFWPKKKGIEDYSGDQIKSNEIGMACSTYVESRGAYRILVGKLE